MNDIRSYSKETISNCIKDSVRASEEKYIRILFSPSVINQDNFNQVCELYGSIYGDQFDTVIIVEDSKNKLKKHLPMSSHDVYTTALGEVKVNDQVRNELCDEDDDLFIDDSDFHSEMSLFQQLPMLQSSLKDFTVVSIQVSKDDRLSIVKELAYVCSELYELRNVLFVFCCDLGESHTSQFENLKKHLVDKDISNLLNSIFSEDSSIRGKGAFACGTFIALNWGLDTEFIHVVQGGDDSLLAGLAYNRHD